MKMVNPPNPPMFANVCHRANGLCPPATARPLIGRAGGQREYQLAAWPDPNPEGVANKAHLGSGTWLTEARLSEVKRDSPGGSFGSPYEWHGGMPVGRFFSPSNRRLAPSACRRYANSPLRQIRVNSLEQL